MDQKPRKLLTQQELRDMLDGIPDVLSRDVANEANLYGNATCPGCGHVGASKIIRFRSTKNGLVSPFVPGKNLAEGHAKCVACETEYSMGTGVILSTPVPILTGV